MITNGTLTKFIPFCFSGDAENLARHFENGVIPKVGDVIELVCYEVSTSDVTGLTQVNCRWRVKEQS